MPGTSVVARVCVTSPVCDVTVVCAGNDVSALGSVPAAVFCFLRALRPIADIDSDNEFVRTVVLAIALGGDTDTIASMAGEWSASCCEKNLVSLRRGMQVNEDSWFSGAMTGALLGEDVIPLQWRDKCEGVEDSLRQAEALLELAHSNDTAMQDDT